MQSYVNKEIGLENLVDSSLAVNLNFISIGLAITLDMSITTMKHLLSKVLKHLLSFTTILAKDFGIS
jgi:hypothetical protein